MNVCRFTHNGSDTRIGLLIAGDSLLDLTPAGIASLSVVLDADDPVALVREAAQQSLPAHSLASVRLHAPIEHQEVWAAGVTYLRSKNARMEESDFSATAYDRVYAAARPEIFFKAVGAKVVGPGGAVGIRRDARWNVPEPELALVVNARGKIVGCTIGNDMSSRDIEGENLLYLPQAKIYDRSCALGPWITLGNDEAEIRQWNIRIAITRGGERVFAGETSVNQLKRSFAELTEYLSRSQTFPSGVVLLTGTGVVPPDSFTLRPDDLVEIDISGIGQLQNRVVTV